MKILYVAASPVPSKAANSVHVVKMAQALAKNGHEVVLMAPIPTKIWDEAVRTNIFALYDVERIFTFVQKRVFLSKIGVVLYGITAYRKARRDKMDFVFTRCLPTATIMALLKFPVIYERHADFGKGRILHKWMYKLLIFCKSHLATIVVSQALKDYFLQAFKINDHQIIVAPDGSDPLSQEAALPPAGGKSGRKSVGYVGHLYAGRGIEIIAYLAEKFPSCDFHVVGGHDHDVKAWKKSMSGVGNIFLHGHVSHAETKNFMMSFDILLAPYQRKVQVHGGGDTAQWMSPLKVFEYMASGKPFICSDIPVLREVLEDGTNCLLCPPEDRKSWEDALRRLVDDNMFAKSLGERARAIFLQKYTWSIRARNILQSIVWP